MIKKLQHRFIRIALVSLATAMILVVLVVNAANWISVRNELRDTLSFLAENGGSASREAMKHWAAQFSTIVRVVSPESLVDEIREEIRKAADNYDMK